MSHPSYYHLTITPLPAPFPTKRQTLALGEGGRWVMGSQLEFVVQPEAFWYTPPLLLRAAAAECQ